jgi:hypothetical protein
VLIKASRVETVDRKAFNQRSNTMKEHWQQGSEVAQREPAIRRDLNHLRKAIEDTENAFGELAARLIPVRNQQDKKPIADNRSNPSAGECEVAEEIAVSAQRISAVAQRIDAIRLELEI